MGRGLPDIIWKSKVKLDDNIFPCAFKGYWNGPFEILPKGKFTSNFELTEHYVIKSNYLISGKHKIKIISNNFDSNIVDFTFIENKK